MQLLSWLRKRIGVNRVAWARRQTSHGGLASRARPGLELLEDRCLMSAGALDPTFGSGGVANPAGTNFHGSAGAAGLAVYSNAAAATAGDVLAAGYIFHGNYWDL